MSSKYNISLVTGDGIGPEISESALSILEIIINNFSFQLEIKKLEAGDTVLKILERHYQTKLLKQ